VIRRKICTHLHTHWQTSTHHWTHVHTLAHTCTHWHTSLHALAHTCTHMHILAHTCTHHCTHVHTLAHTCTHSHTLARSCTPLHTPLQKGANIIAHRRKGDHQTPNVDNMLNGDQETRNVIICGMLISRNRMMMLC
jgi:hypothetical protein